MVITTSFHFFPASGNWGVYSILSSYGIAIQWITLEMLLQSQVCARIGKRKAPKVLGVCVGGMIQKTLFLKSWGIAKGESSRAKFVSFLGIVGLKRLYEY